MKHLRIFLVLCFLFIGCSDLFKSKHTKNVKIAQAWETSESLRQPESVVFDPFRKLFYVSNINGKPTDKDGNGFISKVSLHGDILNLSWIKGLNAPKGLAIYNDKLYVTDIDVLIKIDLKNGKILNRYKDKKAKFLNDIAVGKSGIYVSDMLTNSIYILKNGVFKIWVQSEKLEFPNGLHADNENLIVASWGVPTNGFQTKIPGHIKSINYNTKNIADFGNAKPIGNLDGIKADCHGNYYVTDWMKGAIFHVSSSADVTILHKLQQGTADFEFVKSENFLIVPMMNNNKLIAFEVLNSQ
jgi:sugar lactone lactonase YvrE